MARTRGSYPYPVLDRSDDVDSEFTMSNTRMMSLVESMQFDFEVQLTDDDLRKQLLQGNAKLVMKWRCAETFRLGQVTPHLVQELARTKKYTVAIPQDEIDGPVNLELQIVAAVAIPEYQLSKQNEDYGDTSFSIQPGDVLALGGYTTVQARKLYDPMQPPLESCFEFKEDEQLPSGIQLEFSNQDHVVVWIASATFRDFVALRSRPDFQIAAVMLPALMATLTYMKHEAQPEDLAEERAWHKALSKLIEKHKVDSKSVIEQAQAILEDPIGRSVHEESLDREEY